MNNKTNSTVTTKESLDLLDAHARVQRLVAEKEALIRKFLRTNKAAAALIASIDSATLAYEDVAGKIFARYGMNTETHTLNTQTRRFEPRRPGAPGTT